MQEYPVLDLMIIGAQKSFTTSLKNYLGEHPSVLSHPQQEMAYFISEDEYSLGFKHAISHYYRAEAQMKGKKLIGKNAILYTSEIGLKRLAEHNPDCKLVLNLRNPVDRAYSAYLMEYNFADVLFPFEEIKGIALKADKNYWPYTLFIDAGNYAKHLKVVYKYFPREQVKVVLYEDIKADTLEVCKSIFRWMGIDESYKPEIKIYNPTVQRRSKAYANFTVSIFKPNSVIRKASKLLLPEYYNYKVGNFVRNLNKTKNKYNEMDTETRNFLVEYFRNSNKELEAMTGRNISSLWNK